MAADTKDPVSGSGLGRKGIALVVLLIAGWLLLKLVIGVVTAIATSVIVVLAIVAVVWALRTLL